MPDEIVVQTQGHGEAVALHDGSMKGAEDDGLVEVVDVLCVGDEVAGPYDCVANRNVAVELS